MVDGLQNQLDPFPPKVALSNAKNHRGSLFLVPNCSFQCPLFRFWDAEANSLYMGMDQYLLIPFLGGWTSIYQLFWCSPGVQGFDTLPHVFTVPIWACASWNLFFGVARSFCWCRTTPHPTNTWKAGRCHWIWRAGRARLFLWDTLGVSWVYEVWSIYYESGYPMVSSGYMSLLKLLLLTTISSISSSQWLVWLAWCLDLGRCWDPNLLPVSEQHGGGWGAAIRAGKFPNL